MQFNILNQPNDFNITLFIEQGNKYFQDVPGTLKIPKDSLRPKRLNLEFDLEKIVKNINLKHMIKIVSQVAMR